MPKRTDLHSILIIGAGPIIIGQACEFDYSGAQACKTLREEGYRVILVNSNPATIMTDPNTADATYIEPIHWEVVAKIIEAERPQALLPTMGGQTALNCALELARQGVLAKFNVELIGASQQAIDKAEDREQFRQAMRRIGLEIPKSNVAHTLEEALELQKLVGYPTIIRPSFTLGGAGGGIAYNRQEFVEICSQGFELSPISQLLIEESIIGWKEFEMEVVRDHHDNCIIVCAIENIDPVGIHTGDSITVAPAQTLTDKEYQWMRDASIAVLREIGIATGGSNVQFGLHPTDGRRVVIEMNPRVSRSSALASKATGFPIAKVATKLAVGYTLDELRNEITDGCIPTSFEPALDYVVIKIPRFNFEKFPHANSRLTTQMKSVGEVMAIGRNFQESLQKALRGLEIGANGLISLLDPEVTQVKDILRYELINPGAERIWYIGDAFRIGLSIAEIQQLTGIDPWFLAQIEDLINTEMCIKEQNITPQRLRHLKKQGFTDSRLAELLGLTETTVRNMRHELKIFPVYKRVDTCAAEFTASTAYLYASYDEECEALPTNNSKKIIILGSGPNRIGQGIEFDYCCVQAAFALREDGYETIMINCNPETVSTDYDISNRLYFEPLFLEDVLEIITLEKPMGVLVQYGGQTPLKLAQHLEQLGIPIIGTSPEAIDRAEDRQRFQQLCQQLAISQPANATVNTLDEALQAAQRIGYPLVVRPSYVLGGRAMEIVHNQIDLKKYWQAARQVSNEAPILLDRFLENALEVDIDAISDGSTVFIGGIMEHIEQAGIHSGDSSCSLPPHSLSQVCQETLRSHMCKLAKELGVIGLMNAQFAIQGENIYILEVNPRASRTVPFVSKATGIPLAKIAVRCMLGQSLAAQGITKPVIPSYYSVKVAVFPFAKLPGADPILGPEMKSTGEVMGIGNTFGEAFAKAQLASGFEINSAGRVFISVRDVDKEPLITIARDLVAAGFLILASEGTAKCLTAAGVVCQRVNKVMEGRPHIVDMIKNDEVSFIINTVEGRQAIADSYTIRRCALQHRVAYTTTLAGAWAATLALNYQARQKVSRLQDLHKNL